MGRNVRALKFGLQQPASTFTEKLGGQNSFQTAIAIGSESSPGFHSTVIDCTVHFPIHFMLQFSKTVEIEYTRKNKMDKLKR